jgi:DNA-binding CsgD family transcriptional regulator
MSSPALRFCSTLRRWRSRTLTPAEARVAGLIAEGRSVEEITGSLSVSSNTVRTQLKSVFTKTGVGRQAELVTLLSAHGLRTPHWRVTPE